MSKHYPIPRINGKYQRPGKDHDPIAPWVWADLPLREDPVELTSYPIPAPDADGVVDERATVMVRMKVGDPTTLRELPLRLLACFSADRHQWWQRPRRYYGDNPTAFVFEDEVTAS